VVRLVVSNLTSRNFSFLFFVLYVDLKPSDDFFKNRKKNLSPNGKKLSMEKFKNFCQQKWIFAVFAFFSTVFWRISEFSALTQICSGHFRNCPPISYESRGTGLF
jgi:hypothetical protein